MRHLFSETEKIAQANRPRANFKQKISGLDNWTKTRVPKSIAKPLKSNVKEHSHCRECGRVLEQRASRIWGICPICDTK